jgi:hypothetical protein
MGEINIGTVNSGSTIIGGQGGTISGDSVVNVYGDQLTSLRAGVEELMRAVDGSGVPAGVRHSAESAREEAAKPAPDPGRLRTLVERVRNGAGGIAVVTQAAVNVLGIIKGVH